MGVGEGADYETSLFFFVKHSKKPSSKRNSLCALSEKN